MHRHGPAFPSCQVHGRWLKVVLASLMNTLDYHVWSIHYRDQTIHSTLILLTFHIENIKSNLIDSERENVYIYYSSTYRYNLNSKFFLKKRHNLLSNYNFEPQECAFFDPFVFIPLVIGISFEL